LGGGIDDPLRVAVVVAVVLGEMGMNVIHDWRL
jgi:hypothetical protein